MVPIICRATIGQVGNADHELVNIGKAGRKRNMGIRPTVRGSVMNPNDHPHGGGAKRKYRIVDFKRKKDGVLATVIGIEYDPNRSANIALICYADGEKAYILAPVGLKVGDVLMNGAEAEIRVGN